MSKLLTRRLWRHEEGFGLIEAVAAMFIAGTVVVGTVVAMGTSVKVSGRSVESVKLLQLARAQVELIQQSPFQANASNYPALSGVPAGFTVTFTASDPGTTYTYPAPLGTTITGAIQKIKVTATGDYSPMSLTFYKIRMP